MKNKDNNPGLNAWIPSQMGLKEYQKCSYTFMPLDLGHPKKDKFKRRANFSHLL
jgi:hypothetical protein